MAERHRVKITVLKRFSPSEVFEESPVTPVEPGFEACGLYRDGQEFIVGKDLRMPEGFCQSTWHSIYCSIRTLAFGGNLPWFKEKGVAINCCIDGLRPVVFKLERI
ncbi:MAG: TIGR04076 family protein [Candidatus Bathyarchaeia archaeon]